MFKRNHYRLAYIMIMLCSLSYSYCSELYPKLPMLEYNFEGKDKFVGYNPNKIWIDSDVKLNQSQQSAIQALSSVKDCKILEKPMDIYNDIKYELTGGWLSEAEVSQKVYELTVSMVQIMIDMLANKIKEG